MPRRPDVLYVTHYFPPEVNAPALRVSQLVEHWRKEGHSVTVLTGFPNHPSGQIPREYSGEWLRVEERHGVKVIRTWVYAAANKGTVRRTLNYLSFMLSAVAVGGWKCGRPAVIIGTSPQMFVAVAAWILSLWKRARFVFEVRDLWPEEIRAVDALRNRWVLGLLEALELFLYRRADRIVAVAQGTVDTLLARGVPRGKLGLIPNGVDLEQWPVPDRDEARRALGMEDGFVVSYVGTHGMAQRLETVLDAASGLLDQPRIRILMVGDGAERATLERLARSRGLTNVTFYGQVSHAQVPIFYSASNVCLVPLRRADLFTRNIPSKMYEIMASSRPLILGAQGESSDLVERAGCGLSVAPDDGPALAAAIRSLHERPDRAASMGASGRRFVEAHHNRRELARKYWNLLCEERASSESQAASVASMERTAKR